MDDLNQSGNMLGTPTRVQEYAELTSNHDDIYEVDNSKWLYVPKLTCNFVVNEE